MWATEIERAESEQMVLKAPDTREIIVEVPFMLVNRANSTQADKSTFFCYNFLKPIKPPHSNKIFLFVPSAISKLPWVKCKLIEL